ncbi:MAG: pirin-like C-terminal cupin domain-containing protein, partial [Bacteroidota bacterium]
LPAAHKMTTPGYQLLKAADIPVWHSPEGRATVKVIAGRMGDVTAAVDTFTPIMFLHAVLQPGATVDIPIPAEFQACAYVIEGAGTFGPEAQAARDGQVLSLSRNGDFLSLAAPESAEEPLSVLILGGQPLEEPVKTYGPFVMNTSRELIEAIEDYNAGKFGQINF